MRFVFWKNNLRRKGWGDEMAAGQGPQWRGVEGMGQREEKKGIDCRDPESRSHVGIGWGEGTSS